MIRGLAAGLVALLTACGCNVASVKEQASSIPQNKCVTDADCAFGSCDTKICRTKEGGFDTILFGATPPAGVEFIKEVNDVTDSKNLGTIDLQLDSVAKISGKITTAADACTPQFLNDLGKVYVTDSDARSIPALVTVTPHASALGLFSSPVAVTSGITLMSSFLFNLAVPDGVYDVYIQPPAQPTADCPIPPQLLRSYTITGMVDLSIALPNPSKFALSVAWPRADGGLDRWTVDMLEPISGHVISNRVQLTPDSKGTTYVANLVYFPVVGDDSSVDQFVRLSPPSDVTAPTLLFARSGLGLFSATSGTLNLIKTLPTPVHISGSVTRHVTPEPVAATITLVANKVTGIPPGVVASFVLSVPVTQDGSFDVEVLPGSYSVYAVPTATASFSQTPLGEASLPWEIGTSPSIQAGKVIELPDTLPINGQVLDPSNAVAMTGAQVQAVASPGSITTDLLHQALGEAPVVPRAASDTVDGSGGFKLKVDTGTYDFSVRPRASSGYAWLVIPRLPVLTTNNGVSLDTLTMPEPLTYHGVLTGLGADGMPAAVPGALIDAYIYMKAGAYTAQASEADSVLQIGEARCDETGAFDLRIPATLNALPQ